MMSIGTRATPANPQQANSLTCPSPQTRFPLESSVPDAAEAPALRTAGDDGEAGSQDSDPLGQAQREPAERGKGRGGERAGPRQAGLRHAVMEERGGERARRVSWEGIPGARLTPEDSKVSQTSSSR